MVSRVIEGPFCRLEYEPNNGGGETLARCVPNIGMVLYEIHYRYGSNRPWTNYYLLAPCLKQSRAKFRILMPWIHDFRVKPITDPIEAQRILSDKNRMPLNV